MARSLIGRRGHKHDTRKRQNRDQHAARQELLSALTSGDILAGYGPESPANDPAGDRLDALYSAPSRPPGPGRGTPRALARRSRSISSKAGSLIPPWRMDNIVGTTVSVTAEMRRENPDHHKPTPQGGI